MRKKTGCLLKSSLGEIIRRNTLPMPGKIAMFAHKAKRLSLPANRSAKTIKTIPVIKVKPQSVQAAQSGSSV